MLKLVFRIAVAMTLAAVSWWVARQMNESERVFSAPGHEPDFFITGFSATALDEQGRPRHRLRAQRLVHYIDDDSTEVTRPVLTVYDGDRPDWSVRSEEGWMSPDGELILLNGQVTIDRVGSAEVRELHVETSNLRVYPKKDYAESDEFVRVTSGEDWLTSTGFQGWFKAPIRLKFLSGVRGRYELEE